MANGAAEAAAPPPPPQAAWQPCATDVVSRVIVNFQGLERVPSSLLLPECGALGRVRTLGDLEAALQDATSRMEELGVFKTLQANVRLTPSGPAEITFVAEERGRSFTVGGNVDKKGEVKCDVKLEQHALLGYPYSLSGSASSSVSQAHEFLLRLTTPRFAGLRCHASLEAARESTDETEACSFSEQQTHATLRFATMDGGHSAFLQAALRDLLPSAAGYRFPSSEVQQSRLASIKTSVGYSFWRTWSYQGLAMPWLRGAASLRGSFEAAGAGGDARFLRSELKASSTWQLPNSVEVVASATAGLLLPRDGLQTCIQDRFFLGGASGSTGIFKGFAYRGLGPAGVCEPRPTQSAPSRRGLVDSRRQADALGGDAMLNAHVVLSSPLPTWLLPAKASSSSSPFTPDGSLARCFVFCGAGSLVQRSSAPDACLQSDLRDGLRASTGIGIGMPLAGGSLELTFSWPWLAQKHDVQQRWQVGLRLAGAF
eukprot:TRINITY_DN111688_c0_g1_i1.p1 TRINITY_DN111688_c0_g1~~TRINITY_DN111688_c0_g1_i1.p1  ORF type:complete len:485 (-),score=110.42 TRINITY_DN111688_c0_g1_i1:75-1529(-)